MPIPKDHLPEPARITPTPPMSPWRASVLTVSAIIGVTALAIGLGAPLFGSTRIGSAAISNPPSAAVSSVNRFGPNAEVALIALATRYAETPAVTPAPPGPLAVWLADAPQPTREPTHTAATATIAAQLTAVALIAATATAEARPQDCNTSPDERVCFWPTPTPVVPTATPMPICGTPVPGDRCFKR